MSTEISAPPPAGTPAVVTYTVGSTAVSVSSDVHESFAQKTEAAMAAIPTTSDLRALPAKDIHHTPKTLVDAAVSIGEVADAIEKDPSLAPQGIEFYGKCARKDGSSISARAVCLSNLRELARKTGATADESGIEPDVVRSADRLGK
jgi:hypothetical protein